MILFNKNGMFSSLHQNLHQSITLSKTGCQAIFYSSAEKYILKNISICWVSPLEIKLLLMLAFRRLVRRPATSSVESRRRNPIRLRRTQPNLPKAGLFVQALVFIFASSKSIFHATVRSISTIILAPIFCSAIAKSYLDWRLIQN